MKRFGDRILKAGGGWNCYLMQLVTDSQGQQQPELQCPTPPPATRLSVRPWFSGKLNLFQVQKPPGRSGALERGGAQGLKRGPVFFQQDWHCSMRTRGARGARFQTNSFTLNISTFPLVTFLVGRSLHCVTCSFKLIPLLPY